MYNLIYFVYGKLPWQGIALRHRNDKYKRIMELKMNTPTNKLCQDLPEEMNNAFKYIKNLKFDENPDYNHIRNYFKKSYHDNNYGSEKNYDWIIKERNEEKNNPYLFLKNYHAKNAKKNLQIKVGHLNQKMIQFKLFKMSKSLLVLKKIMLKI